MDLNWAGLLLVALGGIMQGSFALPQKFVRNWAWEKTWLCYSVFGMIVFPWAVAAALLPDAAGVYGAAGGAVLARTALFGLSWGAGSVLFGLGLARMGMALGFAIIMSIIASVGSLVPMAVLHPDQLFAARGAYLMAGLAIVVAGLAMCARAGALRERSSGAPAGGLAKGIVICVASGVLSSGMSFSYAFGEPIAAEAVRHGAERGNSSMAIFVVAVTAGFFVNLGYCLYLLARRRTWNAPAPAVRNAALAAAMGALWFFGFFYYGVGYRRMGELGDSIGWPLLMMTIVLASNLWSLATGEWKKAGAAALRSLAAGMAILLVAFAVIAAGTRP